MARSNASYRLVDEGFPYKKIVHGRAWVGRVIRVQPSGGYYGRIENKRGPATEFYGVTEIDAFEGVVALQLGYRSASELHASNRAVRASNRARNERNRGLALRFARGDLTEKIAVVDELLGLEPRR